MTGHNEVNGPFGRHVYNFVICRSKVLGECTICDVPMKDDIMVGCFVVVDVENDCKSIYQSARSSTSIFLTFRDCWVSVRDLSLFNVSMSSIMSAHTFGLMFCWWTDLGKGIHGVVDSRAISELKQTFHGSVFRKHLEHWASTYWKTGSN